jgi:oxygen-dependent protoporphyrinogen oxidase
VRCLVVGGGITGLAAAWEAVQRGHEVTLVEASDSFGGKVSTEVTDGFTIEHGPDSFVAYRPAALQLAAELGLSGQVQAVNGERTVYLRAGGKLRPLPQGMGMVLPTKLGPFVGTRILSWPDKLRAGLDLVLPRQLGSDDVAIGTFLRRRLGAGIVAKLADPMIGGIYGASVNELSLDAVLPSLRENEAQYRSLMLASLSQGRAARAKATGATAPASPFRSFTGGMASLVTALVAALAEAGVTLASSTRIDSLADVDADAVILAGGVSSSAELLRDPVPEAARALDGIPLSSSTVVSLAYRTSAFAEPPTHHGWLEAEPAPISGVTVSSAKWPGRPPRFRAVARLRPCPAGSDRAGTGRSPAGGRGRAHQRGHGHHRRPDPDPGRPLARGHALLYGRAPGAGGRRGPGLGRAPPLADRRIGAARRRSTRLHRRRPDAGRSGAG